MVFELTERVAAKANKKDLWWIKRRRLGLFFFTHAFIPEPHVTVFTDGLFVVRVGQHLLTQGAALRERLLVHLFPDVSNQDLRRVTHAHTVMRQDVKANTEIQQTTW